MTVIDDMITAMVAARHSRPIASSDDVCIVHGEFMGDRLRLMVELSEDLGKAANLAVVDYFGAGGGAHLVDSEYALSAALTARIERAIDQDPKIHASFREHMDRAVEMEDPRP